MIQSNEVREIKALEVIGISESLGGLLADSQWPLIFDICLHDVEVAE